MREEDIIISNLNKLDVIAIGTYGSYSYGLNDKDSDIDYLIIVKNHKVDSKTLSTNNIDIKYMTEETLDLNLLKGGYHILQEMFDLNNFVYVSDYFQTKYLDNISDYLYINTDRFTASLKVEWYKAYDHLRGLKGFFAEESSHTKYVNKYGYSTKLIVHGFRIVNLLRKFDKGYRGYNLYHLSNEEIEFLNKVKKNEIPKDILLNMYITDKEDLFNIRLKYKK